MATSEREVPADSKPAVTANPAKAGRQAESVLDKILGVLSSVRFGVTMLGIVLICAMIGMLIMQVEVQGFQEYYARLTPAQRLIYGKLQFFHIYHAWYFSLLLAITGLNIILASIDRFPTAWMYVAKPKVNASPNFIKAQMFSHEAASGKAAATLAEEVRAAWRKLGFRPKVSKDEKGRVTVFAQRNVWNRLGAYSVHVALLTIFTGGVLTARLGVGGMMEIRPGTSSDKINTVEDTLEGPIGGQATIPFTITCTDLQQILIRPEGGLDSSNTIDWKSYIRIKDNGKEQDALVHLNFPHDYRGYRLFQSQFTPVGNARSITLSFEPLQGGEALAPVTIHRDGEVDVPGIGLVAYKRFFPDFDLNARDTVSPDYNNPAAQLEITPPSGPKRGAMAFTPQFIEQLLEAKSKDAKADASLRDALLVNGNKVLLKTFEKAALGHTLAVQYDPGRLPFYFGSTLLILSLCGVFFFSHQRVWAVIEPGDKGSKLFFGGNVNRNRNAFEARFNSLVQSVTGERRRDNE